MEEKDCLIDVTKVINRLNLIKNLISLEEEDIITEQVNKLQEFQNDNDIYEIISLLHQKSYGKVIIAIESFIKSRNQVAVFVDPEIEALRFEAKSLELKIQQLSDEKLDLEKLLYVHIPHHLSRI